MSKYAVFKCDRCGSETRNADEILGLQLPIPTWHVSRLDCWADQGLRDMCKTCANAYRVWWRSSEAKEGV